MSRSGVKTVSPCRVGKQRVGSGLGGVVTMPVMQVVDARHMAFLTDPGGASFAIWQPLDHIGAGLVNEPTSLCWNELMTADTEQARAFYGALFGWTFNESPGAGGNPYIEISNDGSMNGGMLKPPPGQPSGPSAWCAYISVDDCDKAVASLEALGGSVLAPARDIPPGRFAVVADPHGAVFTLMKVNEPG